MSSEPDAAIIDISDATVASVGGTDTSGLSESGNEASTTNPESISASAVPTVASPVFDYPS